MPEQNLSKPDLIHIIGDVITKIDVARGSLPRDNPQRKELDSWRLRLDAKQQILTDAAFDEGTAIYQSVSVNIDGIAKDIKKTIEDVNKTQQTFENLARLASAVDELLASAAKAV
jgi:hypothetical protein